MPEIIYCQTSLPAQASSADIQWLTEDDLEAFNAHLLLAGQAPVSDERYRVFCQSAAYCLLYYGGLPVARGAVEPYSEGMWEAGDIRTAKGYRNRGFAKEILRFLSYHILSEGRVATCRTEEDNAAMRRVIEALGYEEMERCHAASGRSHENNRDH